MSRKLCAIIFFVCSFIFTRESTADPISSLISYLLTSPDTIDIALTKSATPTPGGTIKPLSIVKYRMFLGNGSNTSKIDSLYIYDQLDTLVYSTGWIDSIPSGDTAWVSSNLLLTWKVRNLLPLNGRVIYLNGRVKSFGCIDTIPDTVWNKVYTFGIPFAPNFILPAADSVYHTIVRIPVKLGLLKTPEPAHPNYDTLNPGETITYYIQCKNDSAFPARNVVIKDFLDDDVQSVVYASGSPVITPDSVRWDVPCLLAYSTKYCTLTVRVGSEFKAQYQRLDTLKDSAMVYGEAGWVQDTTWSNTTTHYIYRRVDVYPTKTAVPPSRSIVAPGDSILYRLRVYSALTGNSIIRGIVVLDTLDPLLLKAAYITTNNGTVTYTYPEIRWTIDSLAPGDTFRGTYWGFVDTLAPIGDSVLNWHRVKYTYPEDSINITSDTTVHYIGIERIVKKAIPDSGSWVAPNDTIHYMLTYYNRRPGDTVNSVTIVDTVDIAHLDVLNISPPDSSFVGNIIRWNIGDIPPNDSFEVWYDARVKATAPLGDTIPNIGVFYGADTGKSYTEHYIGMAIPELQKSATPDSGAIVNPNDTINYQLNCHNAGNRPGMGIVVRDTITNVDNAWTIGISRGTAVWSNVATTWIVRWTIDTLYADSTEWISYGARVTNAIGDSVLNFAVSDTFWSNTTIHYIKEPGIWLNKDAYLPFPDSSVVQPGDTIRYYIAFENRGDDTAHQVIVHDLIDTTLIDTCINITPSSTYTLDSIIWDLGTVAPGYADTLKYRGVIKTTAQEATLINACFSYGIDADTITDTTVHFIRLERAKKWADPASGTIVRHNDTLSFYLYYASSIVDTQIIITDTLSSYLSTPFDITDAGTWLSPYITWTLYIPPGSTDTVSFKASVLPTAPEGDTIYNRGVFESPAGTFIAGPTKHPVGMPHLRIEKWAIPPSGTPVTAGDTINYTLRANSYGTDTARTIIVQDTLSLYFTSPDTIRWNIGNIPPDTIIDTTFAKVVKLILPDTAWGDTIFNIPVLLSPTDIDVDTVKDTTFHPIKKADLDIIKQSFKLSGFLLPEFSCVYPDSKFYYHITITNVGEVIAKDLIITDTVRNFTECIIIDSVLTGPDSVWWNGNNSFVPPNVIGWWHPYLEPANSIEMRFRVHIVTEGKVEAGLAPTLKNEVADTLDTLMNTCWIRAKNIIDSSNTHILYVGYNCGVEIKPDTNLNTFTGDFKVCTLRVKNTGSLTDSISIIGRNSAPGWQILLGGTIDSSYLFPGVPDDSVKLLQVKLGSPDYPSSNTALVIARSIRSERINRVVEDTAVITISSATRIVNIIVEPDTSDTTGGEIQEYKYMRVINLGNGPDVVDIEVVKPDDDWEYELTFPDGSPITDNRLPITAYDTTELLLRLTPPDITLGINVCRIDTLIIWGTSSHGMYPDSVLCLKDSACVITELIIHDYSAHNYPNPFTKDKGTTFVIAVPERSECDLIIYTRKGEVIREVLKDQIFDVGRHEVHWDATNKWGKRIAAGTYIYKFSAKDKLIIKKLVVLPPQR